VNNHSRGTFVAFGTKLHQALEIVTLQHPLRVLIFEARITIIVPACKTVTCADLKLALYTNLGCYDIVVLALLFLSLNNL
jgi:hypothetical protein